MEEAYVAGYRRGMWDAVGDWRGMGEEQVWRVAVLAYRGWVARQEAGAGRDEEAEEERAGVAE